MDCGVNLLCFLCLFSMFLCFVKKVSSPTWERLLGSSSGSTSRKIGVSQRDILCCNPNENQHWSHCLFACLIQGRERQGLICLHNMSSSLKLIRFGRLQGPKAVLCVASTAHRFRLISIAHIRSTFNKAMTSKAKKSKFFHVYPKPRKKILVDFASQKCARAMERNKLEAVQRPLLYEKKNVFDPMVICRSLGPSGL